MLAIVGQAAPSEKPRPAASGRTSAIVSNTPPAGGSSEIA